MQIAFQTLHRYHTAYTTGMYLNLCFDEASLLLARQNVHAHLKQHSTLAGLFLHGVQDSAIRITVSCRCMAMLTRVLRESMNQRCHDGSGPRVHCQHHHVERPNDEGSCHQLIEGRRA